MFDHRITVFDEYLHISTDCWCAAIIVDVVSSTVHAILFVPWNGCHFAVFHRFAERERKKHAECACCQQKKESNRLTTNKYSVYGCMVFLQLTFLFVLHVVFRIACLLSNRVLFLSETSQTIIVFGRQNHWFIMTTLKLTVRNDLWQFDDWTE